MNEPDAIATHAAKAIPARPTERHGSTPPVLADRDPREQRDASEGRAHRDLRGRVDRQPALQHAGARPRERGERDVHLPAAVAALGVEGGGGRGRHRASQPGAGSSVRARTAATSESARPAARSRAATSTSRRKACAAASAVVPSRRRYASIDRSRVGHAERREPRRLAARAQEIVGDDVLGPDARDRQDRERDEARAVAPARAVDGHAAGSAARTPSPPPRASGGSGRCTSR